MLTVASLLIPPYNTICEYACPETKGILSHSPSHKKNFGSLHLNIIILLTFIYSGCHIFTNSNFYRNIVHFKDACTFKEGLVKQANILKYNI